MLADANTKLSWERPPRPPPHFGLARTLNVLHVHVHVYNTTCTCKYTCTCMYMYVIYYTCDHSVHGTQFTEPDCWVSPVPRPSQSGAAGHTFSRDEKRDIDLGVCIRQLHALITACMCITKSKSQVHVHMYLYLYIHVQCAIHECADYMYMCMYGVSLGLCSPRRKHELYMYSIYNVHVHVHRPATANTIMVCMSVEVCMSTYVHSPVSTYRRDVCCSWWGCLLSSAHSLHVWRVSALWRIPAL